MKVMASDLPRGQSKEKLGAAGPECSTQQSPSELVFLPLDVRTWQVEVIWAFLVSGTDPRPLSHGT